MTTELEELIQRLELEAAARAGRGADVVPDYLFKQEFGRDDIEADFALRHKESGRVMFFIYFGPNIETEVSGGVVKIFEKLRASTRTFSSRLALVSVPRIEKKVGELLKAGGIRLVPGQNVSTDLLATTTLHVFREFTQEKLTLALHGILKNGLDTRIYATPFGEIAKNLYGFQDSIGNTADFVIKNTENEDLYLVKVYGESPDGVLSATVPEMLGHLQRLNTHMEIKIILVTRNKILDRESRALHDLGIKVVPNMPEAEAARVIAEHVGAKIGGPGARERKQ